MALSQFSDDLMDLEKYSINAIAIEQDHGEDTCIVGTLFHTLITCCVCFPRVISGIGLIYSVAEISPLYTYSGPDELQYR